MDMMFSSVYFSHWKGQAMLLDENATNNPVAYIIIVLYHNYSVAKDFTKKQIIESLPSAFSNYNIEWPKNRLKSYIEKIRDDVNAENKKEHIFHLKQKLPAELVRQAMTQVDAEWLKKIYDEE